MNGEFRQVEIGKLSESKLNPRTHYNQKKIEELAESFKGNGIIEPLIVRPNGPAPGVAVPGDGRGFEVIAGSRRYRAAKLAGAAEVPVIVRELTDAQALEIMVIENNQREDVNALEEAEGYQRLFARGYSLERLAERIGRSTKYIYDRLKLLQLIPEAKELLLSDKISPGHAILLARLEAKDQKRAIHPENFGVWKHENLLFAPDDEPGKDPVKIVSVRELGAWIDEHVRFDKKAPVDAMLFPETAATIKEAVEEKEKVIQITHNHYTPPDAKAGNNERIYHVSSWKIADGSKGPADDYSKKIVVRRTCDKSVTGVIVVGPERGTAYKVCVHKDCKVHWAAERREREKAKNRAAPGPDNLYAKQEARWKAEQEKGERERKKWAQTRLEVLKACAEKAKTSGFGPLREIAERWDRGELSEAIELLGKPKTIEDLGRLYSLLELINEYDEWNARKTFPPRAKRLSVDVAAILKAQVEPAEQVKLSAPELNAIHRALHAVANAEQRWEKDRKTGLTDVRLKGRLAEELGICGSSSGPDRLAVSYKGGADPAIWFGDGDGLSEKKAKQKFFGKKLLSVVRQVLKIPVKSQKTESRSGGKTESRKYSEPTCTHCGCTKAKPCIYDLGRTCSWINLDSVSNAGLCSNPSCVAKDDALYGRGAQTSANGKGGEKAMAKKKKPKRRKPSKPYVEAESR